MVHWVRSVCNVALKQLWLFRGVAILSPNSSDKFKYSCSQMTMSNCRRRKYLWKKSLYCIIKYAKQSDPGQEGGLGFLLMPSDLLQVKKNTNHHSELTITCSVQPKPSAGTHTDLLDHAQKQVQGQKSQLAVHKGHSPLWTHLHTHTYKCTYIVISALRMGAQCGECPCLNPTLSVFH